MTDPAMTGWETASPEAAGMDPRVLDGLQPRFAAWSEANLHAVLILRQGRLVYERYFTGEDERWGEKLGAVEHHAGLRHDLRSISKSVTSLLVGIAAGHGWVGGLDTPVFDLFPEHADLRSPEKDRITLRHLLTMSAGLAWNETTAYGDPDNSERQMARAADRVRFVLAKPMVRPAGAAFGYNGGLTCLLATLVARAAGQAIDDLAGAALFGPLGIADVEWVRYPDGAANTVSGLRLRPRDLARIGQMVLDGGTWQGQRIVPAGWLADSTAPHIPGEAPFHYGYQWWLGHSAVRGRRIGWFAAFGYGGQRMFVVPELDMVVVVTAGLYGHAVLQSLVGEVVLRRFALAACVA